MFLHYVNLSLELAPVPTKASEFYFHLAAHVVFLLTGLSFVAPQSAQIQPCSVSVTNPLPQAGHLFGDSVFCAMLAFQCQFSVIGCRVVGPTGRVITQNC
ncbi:hypothetical protein LCGC14_0628670 [marine sediment metagenome]|uniref:Uncharacterized protein n=1 Tax=marine sediment metagenome TaxID=412755 RepID=A0A0F9TP39_9ZZZZ